MTELNDITADDWRGIFMYGACKLRLDENGLVPGVHDPDDLHTIGTLCVLANRRTHQEDTPYDAAIRALATLAAALIAADTAGMPAPHLVSQWHSTFAMATQLAGNG